MVFSVVHRASEEGAVSNERKNEVHGVDGEQEKGHPYTYPSKYLSFQALACPVLPPVPDRRHQGTLKHMEWRRGEFVVTCDPAKADVEVIAAFLRESY